MNELDLLIKLLSKKLDLDNTKEETQSNCIGKICMIRCDRSGVFFGKILSKVEKNSAYSSVSVENCRRVWCWYGAASLSQLAIDGTSDPKNCKFPEATKYHELSDVIEIIPMSQKAITSLDEVEIWKK